MTRVGRVAGVRVPRGGATPVAADRAEPAGRALTTGAPVAAHPGVGVAVTTAVSARVVVTTVVMVGAPREAASTVTASSVGGRVWRPRPSVSPSPASRMG